MRWDLRVEQLGGCEITEWQVRKIVESHRREAKRSWDRYALEITSDHAGDVLTGGSPESDYAEQIETLLRWAGVVEGDLVLDAGVGTGRTLSKYQEPAPSQ